MLKHITLTEIVVVSVLAVVVTAIIAPRYALLVATIMPGTPP
jgi:hypothetical protein